MSVIPPTEESLPDRAFKPLISPFESYHEVFWNVVDEPDFGLTGDTPMLYLPAISLATLVVKAGPASAFRPETRGIVTEASIRIAVWKDRGGSELSAWAIANAFQMLYFKGTGERRDRRVPRLGLDLLRAVDELNCEATELWVDVPSEGSPYRFVSVRLTEALRRFEPLISDREFRLTRAAQRRRSRNE